MTDQPTDFTTEKSFSKNAFRPSLVSASWISTTATQGTESGRSTESADNSENVEDENTRDTHNDEFVDVLSPDETEADIARFFLDDQAETPFRELQKTEQSTIKGKDSKTPLLNDDESTPFLGLKICASSEKKSTGTPGNDFLLELDDVEMPAPIEELSSQCDGSSPEAPRRDGSSLTDEEVIDAVKSLVGEDTLSNSVKQWMQLLADHFHVDKIPAELKKAVKNTLFSEAEMAYSQTQVDNSAGSPGSDNAPRVTEEVYRPSEDESGNGSDTDLDSGDEMVVQQGQGGAKEAKKRASKFRKKSAENKDDGEEKAEEENEELKAVRALEKKEISERTQHLMDMLRRDTDELDAKTDEMRKALLLRVKQKTVPVAQQFVTDSEILRQYKSTLRQEGLLDALVVLAGEKGLKVDVDDDDEEDDEDDEEEDSEAQEEEELIGLSDDDEDESGDDEEEEEDPNKSLEDIRLDHLQSLPSSSNKSPANKKKKQSVAPPKQPVSTVVGGHCQSVFRVRGSASNARVQMKTALQQKTRVQSSESVAKKLGLASSDQLVKVLGGIELERRRVAAERAAKEKEIQEREERLARERKERQRQFQEELLRRANDSDSDGEMDESDEAFNRAVDMATVDPSLAAAAVADLGRELDEDEEEEDEDEEIDEEEALMALEEKERREAEKQKIAAEDSEGEEEEDEEEDLEEEGGSEPVKRKKKRKKSTSVGTVRGGADETDEGDSTTTAPVLPRGDSPNSDSTTDAADVSGEGGDQVAVSVSVSGGATEGGDAAEDVAAEDAARPSKKAKKAKQGSKNSEYLRLLKAEEALSKRRKGGSLLEGEAEEEEEEGRQAGLGDYFFGVPKNDQDDERDALKLRTGDLDHIVDDLSDGEGDEVEGQRGRMEEEARLDRLKTKRILEALAAGHKGGRHKQGDDANRGHYGLDELAAEGITSAADGAGGAEEGEEAVDYDDDEEAQANFLLGKMTTRVKSSKEGEVGVDELSDEDEDEEEEDGEVSKLTDAERMERAQRKELENQTYRRFYEQACRNRALKHERKNSEKSVGDQDAKSGKSGALLLPQLSLLSLPALSPSGSFPSQPLPSPAITAGTPKDSPRAGSALAPTMTVARADSRGSPTSSTEPSPRAASDSLLDESSMTSLSMDGAVQRDVSNPQTAPESAAANTGRKRRVAQLPQRMDVNAMRSKRHAGANQLRRTQTHSGAVSQGRTSAGLLSGVLSKEELDAGHGMHMSVSTSKRRQKALLDSSSNDVDSNMGAGGGGSTVGGASLYSIATGNKPSLKRSYSAVARSKSVLQGSAPVSVSNQQYVFQSGHSRTATGMGGDDSSYIDGSTDFADASSTMARDSSKSKSHPHKRLRPTEKGSIRPNPSPLSSPNASSRGLGRATTLPSRGLGGGTESALFAKLASRAGPIATRRSISKA